MPGNLPMMLLVKIAKSDRIGENLIQVVSAGCTNLFVQRDRQLRDLPIRLNFPRILMHDRPCTARAALKRYKWDCSYPF
jgi:hypothetical protein